MKNWQRRVLISVCFLFIPWLCTGGLGVFSYWPNPSNSHNSDYKPYIRAEISGHRVKYGIPFVFLYHADEAPYSIKLTYITHNVVTNPKIVFDRVAVELSDGSVTDLTEQFKSGLTPHATEHWFFENRETQKKPSLEAKLTINNCVRESVPFNLRVAGQLRSGNTVVEVFDVNLAFTPEFDTRVAPTWYWLIFQ